MILGLQKKPQNFPEWLDAATRDLVPSAQARVRPEMEAHYAEAVQMHLKNGSLEAIAQAAALADLGDAYAAARRFQKQYLTRIAVAYFSAFAKIDQRLSAAGFVLFLFASLGCLAFPAGHKLPLWFWAGMMFLQLLVFASACALAAAAGKQKDNPRNLEWRFVLHFYIRMFCALALTPPPLFGVFPSLLHKSPSESFILHAATLAYIFSIYYLLFVQLKLHGAGNREKPSREPGTA
jgi:hypothetical protein